MAYDDRDQVRDRAVMVRMSNYSYAIAKACAAYRHMSVSSYVHWCLAKELGQFIPDPDEVDAVDFLPDAAGKRDTNQQLGA